MPPTLMTLSGCDYKQAKLLLTKQTVAMLISMGISNMVYKDSQELVSSQDKMLYFVCVGVWRCLCVT